MSTVLTKPVLLDETGQAIVGKLQDIQQAIGGTGEFIPINIRVTAPPTKTNYLDGETLDLRGMVVTLVANNGGMYDVTGDCVFSPADGSIVTSSTTEVNISYTWYKDSTVFTAKQPLGVKELTAIAVTTPPTVTEYFPGDTLDLAGMVVTATFSDGSTEIVTNDCTFNPADGDTLSMDDTAINISYSLGGVTKTTTQSISISMVSWANGSDAEIADILQKHYNGEIDLHDFWAVGDERTIHVSAMAATGVGESHPEGDLTFVLMNAGGKTLSDGTTECAFVVGVKENIAPQGYINSTLTNSGGWNNYERRTWCNSVFYNAIPSTIRSIFKQFKNKSGTGAGSTSGTNETTDYFALAAEIEVFGTTTESVTGEGAQFEYYMTAANRIKLNTDSQSAGGWWLRSPRKASQQIVLSVYTSGGLSADYNSKSNLGISPFGCI